MPQLARSRYDAAIIGAGPVGLALAIELARIDLAVLVVERRPPPDEEAGLRPQLLVARPGDLANLESLGLDTGDPELVSGLATRCEGDVASGRFARGIVQTADFATIGPTDLRTLASQRPIGLVPIGRLQRALLDRARLHGIDVVYDCEVGKLRRHASAISLACTDGTSVVASIAIIATGAARALIAPTKATATSSPSRRMIGGVFATSGPLARWIRLELPIAHGTARATVLETTAATGAGTAILVDVPVDNRDDAILHEGFAAAAHHQGLDGERFVSAPSVFATSITTVSHRFIGGDDRAPIAIAGDAAQTGHVFTGQTCFVNLALARGLAGNLRHARAAIVDGRSNDPALVNALAHYDRQSRLGAEILAQRSERHVIHHPMGHWALAGVA